MASALTDHQTTSDPDRAAWREASVNIGFFLAVFLTAIFLSRSLPQTRAGTAALSLLPYPIICVFILLRRRSAHPSFPVGSARYALARFPLLWTAAAVVALLWAIHSGLFRQLSFMGKLNEISGDLEGPLVEEFVFRAALLTSLNRTRLGTFRLFTVQGSTLFGAVIFAAMHCILFLATGFTTSQVLITATTALIPGLAFGIIYQRTQNVWYGVFLHALGNFAQWG